ncbi:unnamed protein product [Schistocephalus solidus]|uniref:Coiled-coil domain containing 160 n=1 Tax=Schistocephalus solidus TaxID=70667 RepID=A0A183TQF0_SCHSO|nr:unnamed protein product [Schistocephalus solidus]
MVELSQFRTICDKETERRKVLEVELQEHKKNLEKLDTRVQTKEARLQEVSNLEEEKKIKEGQLEVLRDDLKASEECRLELNAELREARRQIERLNSEGAKWPPHLSRSEAQVDNFLKGQRTSR